MRAGARHWSVSAAQSLATSSPCSRLIVATSTVTVGGSVVVVLVVVGGSVVVVLVVVGGSVVVGATDDPPPEQALAARATSISADLRMPQR